MEERLADNRRAEARMVVAHHALDRATRWYESVLFPSSTDPRVESAIAEYRRADGVVCIDEEKQDDRGYP